MSFRAAAPAAGGSGDPVDPVEPAGSGTTWSRGVAIGGATRDADAIGAPDLKLAGRLWLPAPRLLWLGLVAAALGIGSALIEPLLLLVPLWLAGLAVVAVVDALSAPRPRDLRVRRALEPIFALGATNTVVVAINNRATRDIAVAVRDEYPPTFSASAEILDGLAPAGGAATLTYTLTPPRRGEYPFGALNLRYPTRWQLWTRQLRYVVGPDEPPVRGVPVGTVRVYPNLREAGAYELLARQGLTDETGLRRARRLGEGTEFERLRDYVPDDEFRRIDWKATARRGKLTTREYETERSQHVLLLLDLGRLMNVAVGPLLKLDWAVNAALMLGRVALTRGDYLGMLTFGAEVRTYLPPRRGRRHFGVMLDRLYAARPELTEPDIDAAFRYLAARNPKRSLVVVFTDLVDPDVSRLLVRYLVHLVPRHVAICVVIDDPAITALAEQDVAEPLSVWQRAIARTTLADRQAALAQLRRSGVLTIDTPADRLTAALINRYLELKSRGAI